MPNESGLGWSYPAGAASHPDAPWNEKESPMAVRTIERILADEFTTVDMECAFDSMLDELYSFESIGGPFESMSPSHVLKEVDPVKYNVCLADFVDNEDFVNVGSDCYTRADYDAAEEIHESELDADTEGYPQ